MNKRLFLKSMAAGSTLGLAACNKDTPQNTASTAGAFDGKVIEWKMITTWPKNFPGLGTGAEYLAELIALMSGGRLTVKVYAHNELVPAAEVFDTVSRGTAQMGHGAAYYWKGKMPVSQYFAATPFGMNAQEMNAWIYYGGGWELWKRAYAPFNIVPACAGNSGVQMGGWFNKEINTLADLKGLKMRIPGLGGEVLKRAGGTPVNLPGGEIFGALQSGTIDATEFVGPYNDLAFGLYKAAKYYYTPGWHEPGTTIEALINKPALEALPDDLQAIVLNACKAANLDMLSEFTARNNQALDSLINEHGVELRVFPDEVLANLHTIADEVMNDIAKHDAFTQEVHDSYQAFLKNARRWSETSELAYMQARQV